jgi:AcrR family transcriptional regulator
MTTNGKVYQAHYSNAKDARVIQTRKALRMALLELLKSSSLENITVRDITSAAGVGYTTFYRHHLGKEELLREIADDEIQHLIGLALTALDKRDTKAAALALCNYIAEHRILWSTLLTGGAAGALREAFIRQSRKVASTRTDDSHWLPPEIGIMLVTSGTFELLSGWLMQDKPMPVEQVATIYEKVVVSPVIGAYK